jgi:DNA-binding SARP family transcriptional activator
VPYLEEKRLAATALRVQADLRISGHRTAIHVIPDLRRISARHPDREDFTTLLMLALYRTGRQGEALAAYSEARQYLVGELGTELGPDLTEMHHKILTGDRTLLGEWRAARRTAL